MKLSDREIENIREYARLAGEDEEIIEMIITANLAGNDKAFNRMRDYLLYKAAPQMKNPDPYYPYPKQEDFSGDLELGMTQNSLVWRINQNELCKNLLCSGIVGAGKTTMSFGLIKKLDNLSVKTMDFGMKQDVRHIACKEVPMLVLRFSRNANFQLGDIFEAPQGVDEIDYQTEVIKCFAVTTFIGESGKALLLEAITTLRAKQGYVDLTCLISYLKRMKCFSKRMADWLSTCVNRLTEFHIKFGKMLSAKNCFPFEKVIERFNIESELDGSGEFRFFFPAFVELRLFKYRIANNMRGNKLRTVIVCDEVNTLAGKKIEAHAAALGSMPTLLEYMPLCREFDIGHILCSNQPSEVSNVLKAQSGMKMSMRLGYWPDIVDIGNSMTLNKEQMEVIVDLPPGHAVVKMQGLDPFRTKIPNFEIEKTVTDDEINKNNQRVLEGTEWQSFLVSDTGSNNIVIPLGNMNEIEEMDEVMRSYLFDVYNRSAVGLTERFKSLRLSVRRGNQITESMNNQGFINIHEINLSGRGSKTKFLELTKKGHDALGVTPRKRKGKGCGFLHELVQHKIAEHLRNIEEIKKVSIEGILLDKSIDILAEVTDGKKIAFETAMTHLNELNNIQKDIEAGCDYIIIVCKDKVVMEKINELVANLSDGDKSRIMVCLVYQILKCKTLGDIFSLKK